MVASVPATLLLVLHLCASVTATAAAGPDALQESIDLREQNNRQERKTQQKIDRLDDEQQEMLDEYHALGRELDSLTAYNDQLQRLITSQAEEQELIRRQVEDIEVTQREIVPLMLRMIDSLNGFVVEDTPFLRAERLQRVALLRDLMDRADVSVAEKYRRVLEAYQIELDYSRTLEAWRGEIGQEPSPRSVDLLRVGRIGWYYQSLDGRQAAFWNDRDHEWVPMKTAQRLALRRALRVARQQVAPELLVLPVAAAEKSP